jgi:hypothetical protein
MKMCMWEGYIGSTFKYGTGVPFQGVPILPHIGYSESVLKKKTP